MGERKNQKLVKEGKGIVLSGSFKTLYEAEEITPFFKKIYGGFKYKNNFNQTETGSFNLAKQQEKNLRTDASFNFIQ